jgi:hypothetical protein
MSFSRPALESVVASIIAEVPPGPVNDRISAIGTNVPGVVSLSREIVVPCALNAVVAISDYLTVARWERQATKNPAGAGFFNWTAVVN